MPTSTMPLFMAPPEVKEIPVKMTQSVEIDWGFSKKQIEEDFDPELDAILDRLCEYYGVFDQINRKSRHAKRV